MSEIERRLERLERWAWGSNPPPLPTLYCSFCGKSQDNVEKLIAGPNVFICNECADLCTHIMVEERKPKQEPSA